MGKDLIIVVGFENICRLCLHSTDSMSDIFPTSGKTSLQQQILCITGLAIEKDDGLPSKICHRCRHIVEQASELRDMVEKSQKILAKTVHSPSFCDTNIENEADPEPFDNETYLESLTDTNDSIESTAEQNSHEKKLCAPDSPEERYNEFNTVFFPENVDHTTEVTTTRTHPTDTNNSIKSIAAQNSSEGKYCAPDSPEEHYSEPNSPQEKYNELNSVFLPENVDHTTEVTTEEEIPSKKSRTPFTCQLCYNQFASMEEVRSHVLQHYVNSENLEIYLDINSRPYLCTVCDEVQPNKARLLMHHRRHLDINPCRCPVPWCQYIGANKFHLRRHRSVHDLRRRQCDLCHKIFHRRDLLVNHIARAHPSKDQPRPPPTSSGKHVVTEIEPYRVGSRWFKRDNHFYVISRQRNATTTLRCYHVDCPARFNIRQADAGPVTDPHNHKPEPWIPSRNSMFQALKNRTTSEKTALSTIYKEEAARYPVAAPHLPFATVSSSMRKWRAGAARRCSGPDPSDFDDAEGLS